MWLTYSRNQIHTAVYCISAVQNSRLHCQPPSLHHACFIAACTRPPRPQPRARASYASPQAVTRPGRHASKQSRDPSSHHTTKQSCDPSSHTTHRRVRLQAVTRPSSHHVTKQSRDPSSHTTLSRGRAHPTHLPARCSAGVRPSTRPLRPSLPLYRR